MTRKLTLIYSPCQVSNHYRKTNETIDLEIWSPSFEVSRESGKLQGTVKCLVEVTFKCRAFHTEIPFSEMLRSVLRAQKLDRVLRQRLSVTLAMKNCPAECIKTVAMESLYWMKMVLRKYYDTDTYRLCCTLKAPRRMIENFTPSQLYQTTMLNWLQRSKSEIALPTECMHYMLECFYLATWTESIYDRGLNQMNIGISHHKANSLDMSLLQRESRLVFLLRIASIVDRAKSLPEGTSSLDLVIQICICDNCIPVVSSALKYLQNTLCYFHSFLPFSIGGWSKTMIEKQRVPGSSPAWKRKDFFQPCCDPQLIRNSWPGTRETWMQ